MQRVKEKILGTYTAQVTGPDAISREGRFTCIDISAVKPYREFARLVLELNGRSYVAEADDFFAALQVIRDQLDREGLVPHVNGACLDVYPSGMARDMSYGLKAYKLFPGKPWGDLADIVDTFGTNAISRLVTVAEQNAHFRQWQKEALEC